VPDSEGHWAPQCCQPRQNRRWRPVRSSSYASQLPAVRSEGRWNQLSVSPARTSRTSARRPQGDAVSGPVRPTEQRSVTVLHTTSPAAFSAVRGLPEPSGLSHRRSAGATTREATGPAARCRTPTPGNTPREAAAGDLHQFATHDVHAVHQHLSVHVRQTRLNQPVARQRILVAPATGHQQRTVRPREHGRTVLVPHNSELGRTFSGHPPLVPVSHGQVHVPTTPPVHDLLEQGPADLSHRVVGAAGDRFAALAMRADRPRYGEKGVGIIDPLFPIPPDVARGLHARSRDGEHLGVRQRG
jgi:hypothetical protein